MNTFYEKNKLLLFLMNEFARKFFAVSNSLYIRNPKKNFENWKLALYNFQI